MAMVMVRPPPLSGLSLQNIMFCSQHPMSCILSLHYACSTYSCVFPGNVGACELRVLYYTLPYTASMAGHNFLPTRGKTPILSCSRSKMLIPAEATSILEQKRNLHRSLVISFQPVARAWLHLLLSPLHPLCLADGQRTRHVVD